MKSLGSLLSRQRQGWSLEQAFYTDPDIFAAEMEGWFSRQWTVIGHRSEVPRTGDYIVRQLFDASIIVVNAGELGLRAYHNVCTHRGSRICAQDGHSPRLVCPYHGWSFRLDGTLQPPQALPREIDPSELGLQAVPLQEMAGMILCGRREATLPSIEAAYAALDPALRHHGLERAKIIERRSYPTDANWKLTIENFLECYHCRPSHPEYFSMNGHVKVSAMMDDASAQKWNAQADAWRTDASGSWRPDDIREPGGLDLMKFTVFRHPIGLGRETHSRDGSAVAPLMGRFASYDGGETGLHLGRFSFIGAYNDHAVLFQFIPRAVERTDVVVSWFIDQDANATDVDIDALTFLWDVTTRQDKQIIEANAAGVRSPAYRPGPYTLLEQQTSAFVADYIAMMGQIADK